MLNKHSNRAFSGCSYLWLSSHILYRMQYKTIHQMIVNLKTLVYRKFRFQAINLPLQSVLLVFLYSMSFQVAVNCGFLITFYRGIIDIIPSYMGSLKISLVHVFSNCYYLRLFSHILYSITRHAQYFMSFQVALAYVFLITFYTGCSKYPFIQ